MELREGAANEAGMDAERIDLIRERAREWVESRIHQALVLLIARRGIVVLHEAYGRIYFEEDSPPTQLDTIFPLSSVSKPVTATCLMILVEEGLVGLNRPVQEYIPEFVGEGKEGVMVHHLLTHTSGWDEAAVEAYAEERKSVTEIPPCPETQHPAVHQHLCLTYTAPLTLAPGQEMSYCSPGYNLVGEIVRRVSGQSLHDFAHNRIFEPLGMADTSYVARDDQLHRVVRRRPRTPTPFGLDDPEYHRQPWPEAGVLSTARDMAAFCQMFLNGGSYGSRRILSPAGVREMTRNQIPGVSARYFDEVLPEAGWGYGWAVKGSKTPMDEPTLPSATTFSHGGSGGVFLSADPEFGLVTVYFSVARLRSPDLPHFDMRSDLFVDMATAAVL